MDLPAEISAKGVPLFVQAQEENLVFLLEERLLFEVLVANTEELSEVGYHSSMTYLEIYNHNPALFAYNTFV